MKTTNPTSLKAIVAISILWIAAGFAYADGTSQIERPLFVEESLFPSGESIVFGIAEAKSSDVVLLENGLDQGFRNGMICEITRQNEYIGEVILVDVRQDRSAGLILSLSKDKTIQFNDHVRIKTRKISENS